MYAIPFKLMHCFYGLLSLKFIASVFVSPICILCLCVNLESWPSVITNYWPSWHHSTRGGMGSWQIGIRAQGSYSMLLTLRGLKSIGLSVGLMLGLHHVACYLTKCAAARLDCLLLAYMSVWLFCFKVTFCILLASWEGVDHQLAEIIPKIDWTD